MALGQHMMLRLIDDRVIAPVPHQRRIVARVVLEQGREDELLAFGLADTHLHILVACSRPDAGQLARRIEISLARRLRLTAGFATPHFKPVLDLNHRYRAFTYVLEQCTHHGLTWDPLHEASNLPDLLGLRLLGAYTARNVRRLLPRIERSDLLSSMGHAELQPADDPLEQIAWASVAAAALPSLRGKSPETLEAKVALVAAIGPRRTAKWLASLLGVSERTVYELRGRAADPRLVSAIGLQLALIQGRRAALQTQELPFIETDGQREAA